MRRYFEIAAFVAIGLALYPVISIGGWLDRSVGPTWTLAVVLAGIVALFALKSAAAWLTGRNAISGSSTELQGR